MSKYMLVGWPGIEIRVIGELCGMTESHDKEKVVQGVAIGLR